MSGIVEVEIDGVTVRVPDFSALYEKRIRLMGRNLLAADVEEVLRSVFLGLSCGVLRCSAWGEMP